MTPRGLSCLLRKLQDKKNDLASISDDDIEGCLFASKKALEIAQAETSQTPEEMLEYQKAIKEIKKNIKKFGKEFKRRQIKE